MACSLPARCLAAALLAAGAAGAYDFSALKPQGYVSDFAGVVDTASRLEIERYAKEIEDRTGAQLAFVTVASLEGEPIDDVANLLFRTWGIGQKKTNEGALLVLAIRDRKSRLEVGYGLEPVLPDGTAGSVLRAMRPALRESHYGDALIAAAHEVGGRILQAKGLSGQATPPRASRQRPAESAIPWETVAFFVILLVAFALMSRRSQYYHGRGGLPVIFFPGNFPGGRFPRGGGGFGGMGGSGGGFGGFGGGSSGGGGASSDW